MTTETNAQAPADGEDTAAVLAQVGGEKTYIGEPQAEEPAETPEAAATAEEGELGEDTAATDGEPKPERVRLTATERVQQAVARQREAERDRDFYRDQALRNQTSSPPPTAHVPQPETGKPDAEKYDGGVYDPQYIEDLTDWKADRAVEKRFTQHEAQSRTQTAIQTFDAKVDELYPDGEPAGITALRRAPVVPQTIVDLVTSSEIGPKLAEHLGDNPRELARLSALAPHLQGRELAKLEQKLAGPPVIPPKTATDAPEPAPTLRGNGGRFKVAGDTSDFAAFEAQYKLGG